LDLHRLLCALLLAAINPSVQACSSRAESCTQFKFIAAYRFHVEMSLNCRWLAAAANEWCWRWW